MRVMKEVRIFSLLVILKPIQLCISNQTILQPCSSQVEQKVQNYCKIIYLFLILFASLSHQIVDVSTLICPLLCHSRQLVIPHLKSLVGACSRKWTEECISWESYNCRYSVNHVMTTVFGYS